MIHVERQTQTGPGRAAQPGGAARGVPRGLPKALRGSNAPQNPWIFSYLIDAARPSCT
jgi:hypothetical protein